MAEFDFETLKKKYQNFNHPHVVITIGDRNFSDNSHQFLVSEIEVEMTSGFEAAMATFIIYNSFERETGQFRFGELKNYILLGSGVVISIGYGSAVREIFRGFIARVNFIYPGVGDIPGVEITAMDVKGAMMAGSYSKQLLATSYSDAVKEILQKTAYTNMQVNSIITKLNISDTPDKAVLGGAAGGGAAGDLSGLAGGAAGNLGGLAGGAAGGLDELAGGTQPAAAAGTIEMVCESDYEFVVRAARKFNYEFFTIGGNVYFRKARSNAETLLELTPQTGLQSFHVEYDISGQVQWVEVRGMDVGKSRQIQFQKKLQNKISKGSRAKALIKESRKVYLDPTVASRDDASYRAEYLADDISYRLGTLEAETVGIPELTPGRFITLSGVGDVVSNTFYLASVRHILDGDNGYTTRITGQAASVASQAAAAAGLSGEAAGFLDQASGLLGGII